MTNLRKISLLTPAYKEEIVIESLLKHLLNDVEYPNYEIIIGIDGDYDDTFNIVTKISDLHPNRIKIDYDKERIGVTAKMQKMINMASGDIVVKFDADMCFGNPTKALFYINEYFDNEKVGAIYYCGDYGLKKEINEFMDPAFIEPMQKERYKSLASRAENYVAIMVYKYRSQFFPITKESWIPIDTHCFRKNLVDSLQSEIIHDDVAFAKSVLDKGYRIELAPNIIVFTPGGQPNDTRALWNQKNKGNVGWVQLKRNNNVKVNTYFFGVFFTFIKNIFKSDAKDVFAFLYWLIVFIPNYVLSIFKTKTNYDSVWKRFDRVVKK